MISKTPASGPATPCARLETDEQSARRIANLVAEHHEAADLAVSLVDEGQARWRVAIHFRGLPDEQAVRGLVGAAAGPQAAKALRFERVAAKDWIGESLAGLAPVMAGRFVVHGAHDRAGVAVNRIGIEVEAALAFGTGHHGTTRGCLVALDRLCKSLGKRRVAAVSGSVHRHPEVRTKGAPRRMSARAVALRGSRSLSSGRPLRAGPVGSHLRVTDRHPRPRILDLGTGSGVLAIAAARALRQRVLATDIDASAVRVARANAGLNRVGALVEVLRADGVAARRLRELAPFDLIFANILLGPLLRFAAPLTQLAAPQARVILSGLLPSQANAVIAAYRALALQRRIDLDGWTTLVFSRHCRPRASIAGRRRDS